MSQLTPEQLPGVCENILDECIGRLPKNYRDQLQRPVISYFRNSPTAGRARGKRHLELNQDLLEQDQDETLMETLPHELAHLLVHQTCDYPTKPHGREWQYFMELLGCDTTVCHRMEQPDLVRKKQHRHAYECSCMIHKVSSTKHNQMLFKGRGRKCTRCGSELVFKESLYD